MPGPAVRTDVVEVYVFRAAGVRAADAEFLQLRRAPGATLPGTWQPIMGHILPGERAATAAVRELAEEVGASAGDLWQLEEVNVFFLHAAECVMLSPGFAVRVPISWEPTLNVEHDAYRWVRRDHADRAFLWPGQRRAVAQIVRDLLGGSAVEPLLRIEPGTVQPA